MKSLEGAQGAVSCGNFLSDVMVKFKVFIHVEAEDLVSGGDGDRDWVSECSVYRNLAFLGVNFVYGSR